MISKLLNFCFPTKKKTHLCTTIFSTNNVLLYKLKNGKHIYKNSEYYYVNTYRKIKKVIPVTIVKNSTTLRIKYKDSNATSYINPEKLYTLEELINL